MGFLYGPCLRREKFPLPVHYIFIFLSTFRPIALVMMMVAILFSERDPDRSLLKLPWKLHYYYEDSGLELYNLEEDPGESINLAESNVNQTREIVAKLQKWLSANDAAQYFEINPLYDSISKAG